MFENPFLIISVNLGQTKLNETFENVSKYLVNALSIQFNATGGYNNNHLSLLIRDIFTKCEQHFPKINLQLNVQSLRTGQFIPGTPDALFFAGISIESAKVLGKFYGTENVVSLVEEGSNATNEPATNLDEMVGVTVLGGTFDRIHAGHKILLTEAVLRASRRVVVGVTDATMIKSKLERFLLKH